MENTTTTETNAIELVSKIPYSVLELPVSEKFSLLERIQELIEKMGLPFFEVSQRYKEPQRFYHTIEHLFEVFVLIEHCRKINYFNESERFYDLLFLIDLYHDSIYNPIAYDNERDSSELFLKDAAKSKLTEEEKNQVSLCILETKDHNPTTRLSEVFCSLDLYCLIGYPMDKLMKFEHQIFKEYQHYDFADYKPARLDILTKLYDKFKIENILNLKGYVEGRVPKIGIYAGTFNPFHIGHENIKNKAEQIFDKVIIVRGYNPDKPQICAADDLKSIYPYQQVEFFDGFIFDFVKRIQNSGAHTSLIKGLRNEDDFKSEFLQMKYINDLKDPEQNINTVFIACDPEFAHISSSACRSLDKIKLGSGDKYLVENFGMRFPK